MLQAEEAEWHHGLFGVFRKMHKVQDFQLVLCADVWEHVGARVAQALGQAVEAEKAKGGIVIFSLNRR